MYELSGKISNIAISYATGKPLLTLEVNEDKSTLQNMYEELKDTEKLSIKIGKFTKKRSLDANAYFHLLVGKIAQRLNSSFDEVKRTLVIRYGALLMDDDDQPYGAMLPASQNIFAIHPYARCYKVKYMEGKEYRCYLLYQRTRHLNSAEFTHLIEGTVSEAKILGIETATPDEVAKMISLLKEKDG